MMEMMMMIPPIVGVPFFCICPSSPRSRIVSPICFFWSQEIILRPIKTAISMAVTLVSIALKDRKLKSPCPGMSNFWRYWNKWYIIANLYFSIVSIKLNTSLTISRSSKCRFWVPMIW